MKNIFKYSLPLTALSLLALFASCQKEQTPGTTTDPNGAPLQMVASFGTGTRLAELPDGNAMAETDLDGKTYDLKNIGLYVYYADDYAAGNVTQPYIRNQECTVQDGMLKLVNADGSVSNDYVFIYDEMTIVAFYPYNAAMSEEENWFKVKADEEKYPITRADYSEQYYIPYRAQATTDPTKSFYVALTFVPKHTYKVEIVVVSDDLGSFPSESDLMILPNIDPVTNTDTDADGKREVWFDKVNTMDNVIGGSNVRQYIAYLWTNSYDRNNIEKGEVLFQSGTLTLIASQNVTVGEDNVYRYGYNMTTGEIFLPTSSRLVHDVPSLKAISGSGGTSYQVCPIDLSSEPAWTPMTLIGGRFDGGGHALENLTINTTASNVGLFGYIKGGATLTNVNLVDPVITVNGNATDTLSVGALCGKVNNVFTDADKQALIANLPDDLSPVVKEAILADLLKNAMETNCSVAACRVDNPQITVTGHVPRVGSVFGSAGEKVGDINYEAAIWDCYSLGGKITVNVANEVENAGGYTGGFIGLNNGFITRCYTTIDDITFNTVADNNGTPVYTDAAQGFGTDGTLITPSDGSEIVNSYCVLPSTTAGVTLFSDGWPSNWVTYTGIWPIYTTSWLSGPGNSFWYDLGVAPSIYPTLQWQRR